MSSSSENSSEEKKKWWKKCLTYITVEPVQLFYVLMFTTSNAVSTNLFIDKVCLTDFDYTEEICNNYTNAPDEIKDNVQRRVAELEMYDGLIVSLPAAFFCLFMGNWSDHNGRKMLMILPFVGNILHFILHIINYYFFYELNSWHLLWGSVPLGLSGSYIGINMGLYGHVSDVTDKESRTMRLSILNGVFSLGYVLGTLMGSALYTNVGNYYLIFGISCGIGCVGILWTVFVVKESVKVTDEEERKNYRFFDWKNIRESLMTCLKKRPDRGRVKVLLLIANFAVFMFPLNTYSYDYLLTQKKFDWTITEYSVYLTIQRVCRLTGLFLLLPLLSKVLKINDCLISSVATLLTVVAYLLMACGQNDWVMYVAAVLQFNSIITVIIRSQCTKNVEPLEIGKIFSMVALAQSIVPLIAFPIFGLVYRATVDTFPGTYLVIVSFLLSLAFASSVFLYIEDRKLRKRALDVINDVTDSEHISDEKLYSDQNISEDK